MGYRASMSIAKIAPSHRNRLRLHGWLLALWALATGFLANAFMLHVVHMHSMAIRYAIGMGVVYLLGFVLGGYWYLKWWNIKKQNAASALPAHASPNDQLAYEQQQEAFNKKLSKFDGLSDLGAGLGDDPLSALLAIIMLIGFAILILFLLGLLPVIATDALAGYVAELLLEFVIGGMVLRGLSKPKEERAYWGVVLRNTMPSGTFLVVVAGAFGWAVQRLTPEASTLLQVFR